MNKVMHELKHHMPFTALGAVVGIFFMLVFQNIPTTAPNAVNGM